MKQGSFQTAQLIAAGVKVTSSIGTTTLETGGWSDLQAVCTIVTTSGTIASFGCWLEGTIDGDNWFPLPFDVVIQQRSGVTLTNFTQLGTNASPSVNTSGFYPMMLANMAGSVTASACTVGYRYNNLPQQVRAAYTLVTAAGGLNFVIDAMVTS